MASSFKAELEAALGSTAFSFRQKAAPQLLPTGVPQLDAEIGGLPRGAITEISGPVSSGRTTLLDSIFAQATGNGEVCALVDVGDAWDPASAAAAGADLRRLLWVRCAACQRHALAVTDLLLQNGGWGVIALDVGDLNPRQASRIPLNAWYRFRLAVENKPTVLLVIGQQAYAGSCSALVLETRQLQVRWTGTLLGGAVFQAARRKPAGRATACFGAQPIAAVRAATVRERGVRAPLAYARGSDWNVGDVCLHGC